MENKKYTAIGPDGKSKNTFVGSRPTIEGNWVIFYNNGTNEIVAIIPNTHSIFLGESKTTFE